MLEEDGAKEWGGGEAKVRLAKNKGSSEVGT